MICPNCKNEKPVSYSKIHESTYEAIFTCCLNYIGRGGTKEKAMESLCDNIIEDAFLMGELPK
jgi:hypothetical protein